MSETLKIHSAEDQKAFFNQLVENLHKDGTLRNFDTVIGEDRLLPFQLKQPHSILRRTDKPMLVAHIGDEPYNTLTTSGRYGTLNLTQKEISLKAASIRAAINRYMPREAFAAYLDYFQRHLDEPSHQIALENAFLDLKDQACITHEEEPTGKEYLHETIVEDLGNLRSELADSAIRQDIVHYPTLALSLAIYYAAHSTYVSQLKAAFTHNGELPEQERENGIYTLSTKSFNQFNHFVLFGSLLPLILYHYEQSAPECPATQIEQRTAVSMGGEAAPMMAEIDQADHGRMRQAIQTAWKMFFDREVTTHEWRSLNNGPQTMTCPAHRHLKTSAEDGLIEHIYDFVENHPQQVKDTMALMRNSLLARQENFNKGA